MQVNPGDILKNAKTILLVDWPDPGVPKSLLNAGFTVFGYSPDKYTAISLDGDGKLAYSDLSGKPTSVDIVNIFRPETEHASIIGKHVLPLKPKCYGCIRLQCRRIPRHWPQSRGFPLSKGSTSPNLPAHWVNNNN